MPPDTYNVPARTDDSFSVTQLSPDLAAVSSFFNLDGMGAGLLGTGFTRKEMTERLVNLARSGEDSTQLKAMKLLHDMGKDLLQLNGHVSNIQEVRTNDGKVTQSVSANVRTLPDRGPSTNPLDFADGITVRTPDALASAGAVDQAGGGAPARGEVDAQPVSVQPPPVPGPGEPGDRATGNAGA